MKNIEDSFRQKLYACDQYVQKLQDARTYLRELLPLTIERYLLIDKIQSSFIDQMNFRFSKLQDSIGEAILRGILTYKIFWNVEKKQCQKNGLCIQLFSI